MSATTQLLERCLAGDAAAVEAVFQTYRRQVYRLAYTALLDEALAGLALQAGLNLALEALRPGISEEDFEVLLYQLTLKACRRETRRARRKTWWSGQRIANREHASETTPPASKSPAGSAPDAEAHPDLPSFRRASMWAAICHLPEAQRVALTLRYDFDLPLERIARIVRSGSGAVHARLSAARRSLGVCYDNTQAADPRMSAHE